MANPKIAIRREFTGDTQADRAQQVAQSAAQHVNSDALLGGRLIDAEPGKARGSGLSFTNGTPRSIAHGLGRRARGFIEVHGADTPSAYSPCLFATAHPAGVSSATHVTLTSVFSGTCFLLVF